MDLPKPPEDQDLKNVIDKLAQFVARNGPEFELMTKNKQKDNQKFSFLFGGEFFNYYQYKVTTEQAILKQKMKTAEFSVKPELQSMQLAGWHAQMNSLSMIPNQVGYFNQQNTDSVPPQQLQEQIKQNEQNLASQHQLLLQQQQAQIEDVVQKMQEEKLYSLTKQCEFDVSDLDRIIQPIIDSCTKEAISNGKSWIFMHSQTEKHCEAIALYLLKSMLFLNRAITSSAEFDLKLHIIYLMNDVIHHSVRKNAEYLKKAMDSVVVPIFCNASLGADEDRERKLSKLLKLWETNEYFVKDIIQQLKEPSSSLANYQASLITEHAVVVQPIIANIQAQYASYQQQHNEYVAQLTSQFQNSVAPSTVTQNPLAPTPLPQNQVAPSSSLGLLPTPGHVSVIDQLDRGEQRSGLISQQEQTQTNMYPIPNYQQQINGNRVTGSELQQQHPSSQFPMQNFQQSINTPYAPTQTPQSINQDPSFNQPSFGTAPSSFNPAIPDLSRPPPGFPPLVGAPPPCNVSGPPAIPFHELPAGLMVPLIKLDDEEYLPLDSNEIRLPPPSPLSDRLMAAVEMFYMLPSHERPRNSEGWEQLGLYEFFKAKSHARKLKLDALSGFQDVPQNINPIPKPDLKPIEKKIEMEVEKPAPPSKKASPPPRSPKRRRYKEVASPMHRRSRSRSRSPRHNRRSSRSPSPRRKSKSKSISPPPRRRSRSRSITPPSFFGSNYGNSSKEAELDESNKGHQLLKRMGWGGAGLGAAEQGRCDPIDAGKVRDKQDVYKGIGVNLNDPFESFRKSKGQAYITRMKARAEEGGKN